jgi:hypothetical protein
VPGDRRDGPALAAKSAELHVLVLCKNVPGLLVRRVVELPSASRSPRLVWVPYGSTRAARKVWISPSRSAAVQKAPSMRLDRVSNRQRRSNRCAGHPAGRTSSFRSALGSSTTSSLTSTAGIRGSPTRPSHLTWPRSLPQFFPLSQCDQARDPAHPISSR